MEKEMFSPMAIDALGEMMNISLGSSATAVSNMLDHRVDITTPTVTVVDVKDFSLGNLEPAIGVEIKYVEGLGTSCVQRESSRWQTAHGNSSTLSRKSMKSAKARLTIPVGYA